MPTTYCQQRPFSLGLVSNPYAVLGGALAAEGRDGADIRAQALAQGAIPKANANTKCEHQQPLE